MSERRSVVLTVIAAEFAVNVSVVSVQVHMLVARVVGSRHGSACKTALPRVMLAAWYASRVSPGLMHCDAA